MKNPQLDGAIAALADEAMPNTGQLLASTDPAEFLHAVRFQLKWAKDEARRLRELLHLKGWTDDKVIDEMIAQIESPFAAKKEDGPR